MNIPIPRLLVLLAISTVAIVAACAGTPAADRRTQPPSPPGPGATRSATVPAVAAWHAVIHRSPTCSCCHEYEAYLRAHGWSVESVEEADISAFKRDLGMPASTWSCHTAIVEGYVVEGHVPLEAIEELLARRPAIDGIALPGMPSGSPGMPGPKAAPFEVLAISGGEVSGVFGSF